MRPWLRCALTPRRPSVRLAVGGLAAFTYLWRLGVPSWNRDEFVYASAGRQYIAGHAGYNLEHPPLGKYLIGASEVLFGHGPTGARLAAVSAAFVTGLVLAALARRVAGDGAALLTFALWVALPKPTAGLRVDRLAMLDVFATGFATLAVLLAVRHRDQPRARRALLVGVVIGLAGAAKLPGLLVAVPIGVELVIARRRIRHAVLTAGATVAAFVVTYLPLDVSIADALRTMWVFQTHEAQRGFATLVDGQVYTHAPWWSAAWFAWHRSAILTVTIATLVAITVVAAVLRRRERAVVAITSGWVLVSIISVAFGPGRYFEHYAYAWAPGVTLLAATALIELHRRVRIVALALAVPLIGVSAASLWGIATLRPADYALAGERLAMSGARTVLVAGPRTAFLGYACRDTRIVGAHDGDAPAAFDAIIVDPSFVGVELHGWPPPELRDHPERFIRTRADRLTVYLRRGLPARRCLAPR